MRKSRIRRAGALPLAAVLIAVALGTFLAGLSPGAANRASADTTYNPFGSPPLIVSNLSPADEATGVAPSANVSATFDRKLNSGLLWSYVFYLTKDLSTGNVPATVTYSTATNKATLNPTQDLVPGSTYHATLRQGIMSSDSIYVLAHDVTWSFTVDTPPQPIAREPAPGATGVPVDQRISITFNKAMLSSGGMSLRKVGGNKLGIAVAKSDDRRTLYIYPVADLQEGTTYEVTLTDAVKSLTGISIQPAPQSWTFTTVGGAPSVTASAPANGAIGVPVGQVISATFDRDMNAATLTSSTFSVAKNGGAKLPATVLYNAETRTATLDPSSDLEPGSAYTVTLTAAVKSQTGQVLTGAPKTWTFTTAGASGGASDGGFTDVVPGVTPYAPAIAVLADRGISAGFPDGTFRPNALVTRQQFAKMIVLTLGLTVTGSEVCPFADVAAQIGADPFYPSRYVAVCALEGITVGKTPTSFAPSDNITHQQLISMIVRAGDPPSPADSYVAPFTAGQLSTPEHYQNARRASSAGLLEGLLGVGPSYNFLAGSTRGECAQLLYRLIDLLGI